MTHTQLDAEHHPNMTGPERPTADGVIFHEIFLDHLGAILMVCGETTNAALKTSKRYRVAIFGLSFNWPWIPKTANFFTAAGLDRDKPKDTDFSASAGGTMATQTLLLLVHSHIRLSSLFSIFLDRWRRGKKWTSLYINKPQIKGRRSPPLMFLFLPFPGFNPRPEIRPVRRQDGRRNGAVAPTHDVVRVDSWRWCPWLVPESVAKSVFTTITGVPRILKTAGSNEVNDFHIYFTGYSQ